MLYNRLLLGLLGCFLLFAGCDKGTEKDPEESGSSSSLDVSAGDSSSSGGSGSGNSSSFGSTGSSSSSLSSSSVEEPKEVTWVGNSAIIITEITPINSTWKDEEGNDPGWVELYNAGSESVNLMGYSLVEKLENPRAWVFGDEVIPAKGFRTVFCDKRNLTVALTGSEALGKNRTHTSWKLEKNGGSIYLIDAEWNIRDSVNYPELPSDVSWGIVDGGKWMYFGTPTPEQPNNVATAFSELSPSVSFGSRNAGFYAEPITLTIPSPGDGFKVRCTQDGSFPTSSSPETSSILISQNTVVRCAAFKDGFLSNKVTTSTYFIGETVKMPVVSIAVDPVEMFDSKNGYYRQGVSYCNEPCYEANYWKDIELPVHVEYFADGSSSAAKAWEIDAGISIMGGWSRYNPKKSVSIVMREKYQDGRLHYPLFATRSSASKFKAFNLRNNGNRFHWDYIEDPMAASLLEGSSVDYQRSRQVVVFYNGEYYGIHDMREKLNEHFVETNYGIDASTVESIKHVGTTVTANGGTPDGYNQMLNFVNEKDFSCVNNENYRTFQTMLDVGSFADYMAAQIYYRNGDWPNNNVRAWRTAQHPWKFMVFDLDHGFDFEWTVSGFGSYANMFSWIEQGGGGSKSCSGSGCFAQIYIKLIKNNDFKRMFINRSAVMLDYYFAYSRVESAINNMVATIPDSEMDRDLVRWERNLGASFSRTGSALKTFASVRSSAAWNEYKNKFGLGSSVSVTIQTEGSGSVQLEGMTLPGSTAASTNYTGNFFSGHSIVLKAIPATSTTVFLGWEDGSTSATRTVTPQEGRVFKASFR